MYILKKEITIECAHQLHLPYDSPCNREHGHSYRITVEARGRTLNGYGMLCDFADLAKAGKALDHQNLNEYINPSTAEMLAQFIHHQTAVDVDDDSIALLVYVKETESSEVLYYE